MRRYTLADHLIGHADRALRTLTPDTRAALRANPGATCPPTALSPAQQREVAGLMRVNHSGEVCAQALYHGQALTARLPTVRQDMERAAQEEQDHLAWCEERLTELGGHISLLNPIWYGLSFGIGAAAGMAGDTWSLGFVAETEKQVCAHLESHMQRVPAADARTHAILKQMHTDEANHRHNALEAGGIHDLPPLIRHIMGLIARAMTRTSYHI